MRNKLIISTFAIIFSLSAIAQTSNGDLTQDTQISVYPNPAVDFLVIELTSSVAQPQFELLSMIGNKIVIEPEDMGFGKYRISLKDFATGYYFLVVKDEESRVKTARKFLKN